MRYKGVVARARLFCRRHAAPRLDRVPPPIEVAYKCLSVQVSDELFAHAFRREKQEVHATPSPSEDICEIHVIRRPVVMPEKQHT